MKNNPIAFDELGNQIAKLDGSPLPQEKWEEKGEKIPFHFRTCPKNNWRDRFDDKFGVEETTEYYQEMARRIKQFISDLRKHDMEELIKMLPESEHSLSHIYCEEMREQGFQGCKVKVKQLIKEYYAK